MARLIAMTGTLDSGELFAAGAGVAVDLEITANADGFLLGWMFEGTNVHGSRNGWLCENLQASEQRMLEGTAGAGNPIRDDSDAALTDLHETTGGTAAENVILNHFAPRSGLSGFNRLPIRKGVTYIAEVTAKGGVDAATAAGLTLIVLTNQEGTTVHDTLTDIKNAGEFNSAGAGVAVEFEITPNADCELLGYWLQCQNQAGGATGWDIENFHSNEVGPLGGAAADVDEYQNDVGTAFGAISSTAGTYFNRQLMIRVGQPDYCLPLRKGIAYRFDVTAQGGVDANTKAAVGLIVRKHLA